VPDPSAAATAPQTRTFLFADLRDYTRFVETFGDAAATTLIGDYRRIVRAEVARAAGGEVKTEGDSFYVVFSAVRPAVTCGMAILREAERYSNDRPDRPMKVGVGIHAGEPVPHEGQYVGAAVIVAARLAQQASAGELLVSDVVRGLLPKNGAPPMTERNGLVLKGIEDAPRIFAIGWQAAPATTEGAPRATTEVAIEARPPTSRQVLCPVVIGRESELAALEAALTDAIGGRGQVTLVAGEAGQGKSALLRLFDERARAAGARVMLGECTEVEARRPFGPFIDALVAASLPLPEELAGGPGAMAAVEVERYRVHAGFARTLAAAARENPLVLAIEDLHWADEATLELVPYLARKLRGERMLLLATYRSDELHRLHPLNHLLAELARGRLAREIKLHKLSEDEIAIVMQKALGLDRAPTTAFRQAIYERCEGNPFFVEEVLRALIERGDLSYREGAWRRTKDVAEISIPVSIRDAVQQRLHSLLPDARRVIDLAAVIGQRFEFELLREVANMDEGVVLDALRAAIDGQLVTEDDPGGEEETYRFRHALTRESILAELLQRERRVMHRAVGEAIERNAVADAAAHAEELAYHFDEARDQERALRYHRLAADEARRVFAFAREVRHLERAIEVAPDDDPTLGQMHLRLAEAATDASQHDLAARAAQEARTIFAAQGDQRRTGEALARLSHARWFLGDTAAALPLAHEAVSMLEPAGASLELGRALAELARLAMLTAAEIDAIGWAERGIAVAEEIAAPDVKASCLITVGAAKANLGRPDARATMRQGLALALEHELPYHAMRAYQNIWASGHRTGLSADERRRIHEEGSGYARRLGLRPDTLISRELIYAVSDGDWDKALELVAELKGDTIWSAQADLLAESLIETARRGPERGLPLIEAPRRRLLGAGDPQWRSVASWPAVILFLAGKDRSALEHAEVAVNLVQVETWVTPAHAAAIAAIAAAKRIGDDVALGRWLTLAEEDRSKGENPPSVGRAAFAKAIRASLSGDIQSALELSAEAIRQWAAGLDSTVAAVIRVERADLFLFVANRSSAQQELDAAAAYWRKAKAVWYLGELAKWAKERGLSA
jgi:class 3 adenylate cyclase